MGWFEEQLKSRMEQDNLDLEESLQSIAGAVMGKRLSAEFDSDAAAKNALDDILRYHHIKPHDIPDSVKTTEERLEYILRPHGIMQRTVRLSGGWYKDAVGVMLAVRRDNGSLCALMPGKVSGYTYFNGETGKRECIDRKNEALFEEEAIAFYKPFPLKKLNIAELVKFIIGQFSPSDIIWYAIGLLAVTLIGMITPQLNKLLFSDVIAAKSASALGAMFVFMICVTVSSMLLSTISGIVQARIDTKLSISVEAASMMRILSLPADFFKRYSSGELSNRLFCMNSLCDTIAQQIFGIGFSSLFSLVYIAQIFVYAPALVVPSLTVTILTVLISFISALWQIRISKEQMELTAREYGMSYAMISGIQKIKLSGAEKRAFARWGRLYAQGAQISYNPPKLLTVLPVITQAIGLFGTLFLYASAIRAHVSVADYYAFNAAYGMVAGAIMSLSGIALTLANIKPTLDMVRPIMEAVPEIAERKEVISRLSGGVELNNISFRYTANMPLVLDNLTLKIRPGQYVAIVGATGCGKSTLMRIMLGFEKAQKGAVYYDGKDISGIDLKSLRRKIGVVMQDGKLFQGDIFSNITISAPQLTMDEAWEAVETAGIADDIRSMPMGMFTIISEGQGGISGGQRQRLLIARAVAPKPRILMFDEATSALDNITQKKVTESLDKLKCTRIVIAHRLSTIRSCDRIIVLDHGKIVEDGSYEMLIAKNGYFKTLVERQRLEG